MKYPNKKDMIREVSNRAKKENPELGINQPVVKAVWNAFVEYTKDVLVSGSKLVIDSFGTFEVSDRSERQGRNPATGEPMTVKAQKVPRFKCGKYIKDAVNGKE